MSSESTLLNNIKFFLNDKMDTMRKDMKEDVNEIKEAMKNHNNECKTVIESHDKRISELESIKDKFIGALYTISLISATVSSIVTTIIIFAIKKYLNSP